MIVVRMEIWPGGDQSRARELGVAHIANDGSGTATVGNYDVRLLKSPEYAKRPGVWRRARVVGFPRLSKLCGPWELLFLALELMVAKRARRAMKGRTA